MAISLRILAEDIMLLRNGGQPLSDDESFSERQIMFLIATTIARKFRSVLVTIQRGGAGIIDPTWYSPLELTLTEDTAPRHARWLGSAALPTVMTSGITPVLKEVTVDYIHPLIQHTNAFSRYAGMAHGTYGVEQGAYSVTNGLLKVSTPLTWREPEKVSFEAILIPSPNEAMAQPDKPITIPFEWLDEIRGSVLDLLYKSAAGGFDAVNNGTDGLADRQPITNG